MVENRRIRKVVRSRATIEGAGVHLLRAIGFGDPQLTDVVVATAQHQLLFGGLLTAGLVVGRLV